MARKLDIEHGVAWHPFGSRGNSAAEGWFDADRLTASGCDIQAQARVARVKRYLRQRRRRDQWFPPHLFADPAWDILLDLYVCECERRNVSVSNACEASAVPSSTALRCIDRLVKEGLIWRVASESDGRVVYLRLFASVRNAIAEWAAETFS